MKLKNVSPDEKRVFPSIGRAFTCAAGELTPDLADVCAEELLRDPTTWEHATVKHTKHTKKES